MNNKNLYTIPTPWSGVAEAVFENLAALAVLVAAFWLGGKYYSAVHQFLTTIIGG